jgi:ribonuclease PH
VRGNKYRNRIGKAQVNTPGGALLGLQVVPLNVLSVFHFRSHASRSIEISLLLRQSFESVILTSLYPGSTVSLFVQVLSNDGGAFAASVNALTLALTNAGIPMKDMLIAATVGMGDTTPLLGKRKVQESEVEQRY